MNDPALARMERLMPGGPGRLDVPPELSLGRVLELRCPREYNP
ncbi:MAG: hypothetical protein ACE5D3_04770 [Candidatus Binatia bacterium]